MKHLIFTILTLFLLHPNAKSQDVLLFPESAPPIDTTNSIVSCMANIAPFIHEMDIDKIEKLYLAKRPEMLNSSKFETTLQNFRSAGYQLLLQGQRQIAGEVFTKLLKMRAKTHGTKSLEYSQALVDLGRAYILLIKYKSAIGLYEEALNIVAQQDSKSQLYLTLLNEIGMLETRAREYDKALDYFDQALTILNKSNSPKQLRKAILINNIGACHKSKHQYQKAVDFYQKALKLQPLKGGYTASIAANLAEALVYTGQKMVARQLLETYEPVAAKVWQTKSSINNRGWSQFALAYITLGESRDLDKAETALEKAFVANSLTFNQVTDISTQAQDLMFQNNFLAACSQAGTMLYTIELYKTKYEATGNRVFLEKGYQVVLAMSSYGEQLMNSYAIEDNKLMLFRLGASILFDKSIYYAHELYQITGDQKYLNQAFFWAERSKSTLLVNALSNRANQYYIDLPETIKKQEKQLQNQAKKLDKRLVEVNTQSAKQEVLQQVNRLKLEIEKFKETISKDYPDYYEYRYDTKVATINQLQQNLTENQVLVEYFLGADHQYAFVIHKDKAEIIALDIEQANFEEKTTLLRKVLTDYTYIKKEPSKSKKQFVTASNYFYQKFMAPVLKNIPNGQHLIIVPDGALGHLPFEIFLPNYLQGDVSYQAMKYLLHDYSLSYGYSATVYLTQKNQQKKRSIAKKGILAFAADYDNTRLSEMTVRGKRGEAITNIRKMLEPLPGAKAEVATLRNHLYGEFFDDNNANEEVFKATAKDYSIIHLAMHGMLDTRSPILSSLIFSEDSTTQEDNFLRAYEIAQMDLNADLVVLSACETGYGKFQQGEGIMSLAHSFTYAGASSVLNSLWQVNDFSTGQIMKNYYTNLARGFTKDKALQHAKLAYLENTTVEIAQHPAYWAAFIQQGNVRPLELVCRSGFTFRQLSYISMAVMILLVGGFYWWKKSRKIA